MIILEIQNNDSSTSSLKFDYNDPNKAEQVYHEKLAVAAVSTVKHHTVALITDFGDIRKKETYHHDQTPKE